MFASGDRDLYAAQLTVCIPAPKSPWVWLEHPFIRLSNLIALIRPAAYYLLIMMATRGLCSMLLLGPAAGFVTPFVGTMRSNSQQLRAVKTE